MEALQAPGHDTVLDGAGAQAERFELGERGRVVLPARGLLECPVRPLRGVFVGLLRGVFVGLPRGVPVGLLRGVLTTHSVANSPRRVHSLIIRSGDRRFAHGRDE
jgi:hypothetical protein